MKNNSKISLYIQTSTLKSRVKLPIFKKTTIKIALKYNKKYIFCLKSKKNTLAMLVDKLNEKKM